MTHHNIACKLVVVLIAVLFSNSTVFCQVDVQDIDLAKLGTESVKAAQSYHAGQALVQAKKPSKAVSKLKSALEHDPKFQLATYWLTIAYGDLGKHDLAIENYERLFELGTERPTLVAVDGCVNAGITEGRNGNSVESERWFSRALILDPDDRFKLSGKVYRNLAITKVQSNDFISAAVSAAIGKSYTPNNIEDGMVKQFASKANSEVATILNLGRFRVPRAT